MVAIGALLAILVERDMAFEDDLGVRRYLQWHGLAIDELDFAAAQQPGELVFRQRVRDGCNSGEDRPRIGPDHRRRRQRLATLGAPALMMLGATAMLEPAHQGGIAAGHLHAVDAEIEGVFAAGAPSPGHPQRPRDSPGRRPPPAPLVS